MSKFEWVAVALLSLTTIASGITAIEVTKLVEEGLEVTISVEEAQELIDAAKAAEADMIEAGE